jgi:hypothetical protein
MYLALNMAKMTKEGFSRAAIEKTKYHMKKPPTEVREEMKRGVEFPGHKKMKAAIQRHPAMLRQTKCPPSFLTQMPSQRNRSNVGDAKEQVHLHLPDAVCGFKEPTPPAPGTAPDPPGDTLRAQPSAIINFPAVYTYSHTALPSVEFFGDDEDTEHDTDFDPDMLTNDSEYTICCVVMQLSFILKTKVAD